MSTTWVVVILGSLGCYALKVAGVSLPRDVLDHPAVQRIAGLLPAAMLAALVAVGVADGGGRYAVDWTLLAGVGAGALALALRRGLVVVFVVAVVTTALLRALT